MSRACGKRLGGGGSGGTVAKDKIGTASKGSYPTGLVGSVRRCISTLGAMGSH